MVEFYFFLGFGGLMIAFIVSVAIAEVAKMTQAMKEEERKENTYQTIMVDGKEVHFDKDGRKLR